MVIINVIFITIVIMAMASKLTSAENGIALLPEAVEFNQKAHI